MYGLTLSVKWTSHLDWDSVAKRRWPGIVAAGLHAAMTIWATTYLPRHWTPYAKTKYQHTPRSIDWLQRRRQLARRGVIREGGGEIDNLVTGLFRELVLGWYEIRARGKSVRFRCYGPRYVTLRPKPGKTGPFKWGEVTTIIPTEHRRMRKAMVERVRQEILRLRKRKTTRLS